MGSNQLSSDDATTIRAAVQQTASDSDKWAPQGLLGN